MEFYRFRSISNILGEYKELERGEIYFASPEELNDPMEGYRDIFWDGDFVVWRNLFRHYVMCLEWMCSGYLISGEEQSFSSKDIPVFLGFDLYPTETYKKFICDIITDFLEEKSVVNLIDSICKRTTKIRRDELSFYLSRVHLHALKAIFSNYSKKGMYDSNKTEWLNTIEDVNSNENFVNLFEAMLERYKDKADKIASLFFSSTMGCHQQMNLINILNAGELRKNNAFIILNFHEEYINQLSKLMYSDWYTACFMSENTNSSVWGHYGDNHTGVCMIFESIDEDGVHKLPFHCKTGYSSNGDVWGDVKMTLHPINYEKEQEPSDFFRSIGRLPMPKLNEMWYVNGGEMSSCANDMNQDIDAWRKKYWNEFIRDVTIKSIDWKYENEYRLILQSSLHSYSECSDRALKYDFSSLKGIIFGIKTTIEHKVEIIKIIRDKCLSLGRKTFDFYQAYYSPNERKILCRKLNLLEFSHPTDLNRVAENAQAKDAGSL